MKSSRVQRARRLLDRALAPAPASAGVLMTPGRCEACPYVPPDRRSRPPVAITDVPQRWDAQDTATSPVNQSYSTSPGGIPGAGVSIALWKIAFSSRVLRDGLEGDRSP